MKRVRSVALLACAALPFACGSSNDGQTAPQLSPADFVDTLNDPRTCVIDCDPTCTEGPKPWACPALRDWGAIPHAPACGAFDGKKFPAPTPGACTASEPAGDALAKTHRDVPVVLPDGRRVAPQGTEWVFDEQDFPGNFPSSAAMVPGTKWLIVDDTGYDVQSIRVLDTAVLRNGSGNPVVSAIRFPSPKSLNWGLQFVAATNTLYVASGIPDSKVWAFTLDPQTGKIAQDDAKTIALGSGVFPQAVAVSPDGKTLVVGQANSGQLLVVSIDPAASYGQIQRRIELGHPDVYMVRFDPNDTQSRTAYATLWHGSLSTSDTSKMALAQIDVAAGSVQTIAVGKAPEDMAFLDARYMVVANALADSLSVVDRPAGKVVAEIPVAAIPGVEPTALAYDPPRKRLYATLSSANAVAVFDVDATATPPSIVPAGMFPTAWWPTSVTVDPNDGAAFVTNGKGHGTGTDAKQRGLNQGTPSSLYRGSVSATPFLDGAAVAAATAKQKAMTEVAQMNGYPQVQCPQGANYDFPIPAKIEDGPSTKIKHVFFIVRENKTYDAIFGDFPGGDGDPNLVMSPGHMDEIWPNARKWAREFAHMDNFYEDAEQSLQGHTWTVFGRTTDYEERRWLVIWGRGELGPTATAGIGDDTAPREGSIFQDLVNQGVTLDNMGELVGGIAFRDLHWPGGSTDATQPDTMGACYVAGRARVLCDAKQFTYAWLSNDHAFGLAAGKPNPGIMVAVNDEATGMFLDGISHSPIWPESLVIVVEDDPQDGGDHVDQHRTIALFASPWVKRKYVSHGHYDMASVHKLFAHVFGKKYRNSVIANAPLPLDIFTSTPDYTPFDYLPRKYADTSCNPSGTTGAKAAEGWDFSEPDDQPGLSEQNMEYLRGLK